ncbi:MAG: hypothetical protein PHU23_01510 [Dehalococcoidales bacterium]|nr:hypothetical protein [Dehalococcoidales bacterium]
MVKKFAFRILLIWALIAGSWLLVDYGSLLSEAAPPPKPAYSTPVAAQITPSPTEMLLTNSNWDLVLAEAKGDQKAYIGYPVELAGKVKQILRKTNSQTQIAIDTKFDEAVFGERTLIVIDKSLELKENSWIKLKGELNQYWKTENLIGAELVLPVVVASEVNITTRSEGISAIVTVVSGESITQNGLTITIDKLEIAAPETRVYIKAENNSNYKASLYHFDAVIVQGTKQIKIKTVFDEDIKEPDSTLLPGTMTEGVILFEPLDPNVSKASLNWSGPRTDDYNLQFNDWVWDFSWQEKSP